MTSVISPFSEQNNMNKVDRLHQKFTRLNNDDELMFIQCEKNGKITSIGISRKDYDFRKKQIANGLICDNTISYSVPEID